jgi:CRISPR/Cas system CSM-associated protein Csm3 (group 7 of RAMP superfamily)
MSLNRRYIASVLIEADTPLRTGGNKESLLLDAPVLRDYNDLPMILGTSIAGALRAAYREIVGADRNDENGLFGFQEKSDGAGSRLVVSNAHLVDENGKAVEELRMERSGFLKIFDTLPVREHVRIGHRGVAEHHGKFDEELCYKGTRWRFELELVGDESDLGAWNRLLTLLSLPTFRLGAGTRKGYGKLKIVSIHTAEFDVADDGYAAKSASLNDVVGEEWQGGQRLEAAFDRYTIRLKPDDFFMFGSGLGDEDADMTPVREPVIEWKEMHRPQLSEEKILIPASSVKGALSHRTAYYYNQAKEIWAEEVIPAGEAEAHTGENNAAVAGLFGRAKGKEDPGRRGRILLSDIFVRDYATKVFDHVKIDRFTGGAKDGALFQEKVVHTDEELELEIVVEQLQKIDDIYIRSFERALKDLVSGRLPLGGNVNRGHGVFTGRIMKNDEEWNDADR